MKQCPSTVTPIPISFSEKQREFTLRLLGTKRVRVEEFEGKSFAEAREIVRERSERFNRVTRGRVRKRHAISCAAEQVVVESDRR